MKEKMTVPSLGESAAPALITMSVVSNIHWSEIFLEVCSPMDQNDTKHESTLASLS